MEAKIAAGVLFCALLACNVGAPQSIAWTPYSKRAPSNQIAVKAISVGEGDLGVLKKAGALPIGTLTMRGRGLEDIIEATATEAAEFGGTHYMMGRWNEETSTVAYHGVGGGNSWTVVPVTVTNNTAQFVVLRVPRSGWADLPDGFVPESFAKEK